MLPFDELWVLRALLLPGEEVEHGGEGGGGHPDVASAGHFHVDDVGAGFLTGFDHVARLGDGDGTMKPTRSASRLRRPLAYESNRVSA